MLTRFKSQLKEYFQEIMKIKTSPNSIALGVAFGTFISILPTPFFNILIGLFVILIFKNISKISLFGSIVFWNPFMLVPVYYLSYRLGDLIFGSLPIIKYDVVILDHIYNFSRRFIVGNLILAVSLSLFFYALTYIIAKELERRRTKKLDSIPKH